MFAFSCERLDARDIPPAISHAPASTSGIQKIVLVLTDTGRDFTKDMLPGDSLTPRPVPPMRCRCSWLCTCRICVLTIVVQTQQMSTDLRVDNERVVSIWMMSG